MDVALRLGRNLLALLLLAAVVAAVVFGDRLARFYDVITLFSEDKIVSNFSNMHTVFEHQDLATGSIRVLAEHHREMPTTFAFNDQVFSVSRWLEQNSTTAIVVLSDGKVAHEEYFLDTDSDDLRISWSISAGFMSALIGILVEEGSIRSLNDRVTHYAPELNATAYEGVTIRDVLTMSSGTAFDSNYLAFNSDINRIARLLALGDSLDGYATGLEWQARRSHGKWDSASMDAHVLGMVVRGATGKSVSELMSEKVIGPMGAEGPVYYLADREGAAFVLGGLNMRTRDYARMGQMYLNYGRVEGRQVVPEDWVMESTRPQVSRLSDGRLWQLGYQWWVAPDARGTEFLLKGIYDQFVYVNRTAGVVIAINAANRDFRAGDEYNRLRWLAFFRSVATTMSADIALNEGIQPVR